MKNEGYVLIDHRASPGLTPEFARNAGLDPKLTAEGKMLEAATLTCSHCNTVVIMNPERKRERGYCRKCDHYVCDNPACRSDCRPFHYIQDRMQEKMIKQQAVGQSIPLLISNKE